MHIDKKEILTLIKKAYEGELVLPDFQRNFVWQRFDVEELIRSLFENMFINSFIVLNTLPDKVPFNTTLLQGVKEVNPDVQQKPTMVLLDGQQRLTALFYVLYAPRFNLKNTETPYMFFVNLEKLVERDVENAVFSWSVKSREYREYANGDGKLTSEGLERLVKNKILPMTVFKDFREIQKIRYTMLERIFTQKELEMLDEFFKNFLDYKVILLSLDVSYIERPEDVVVLFERINKTGVRLSTYDLLTARFYKYIKLREEWKRAFEKCPNIRKYAQRIDNTNVPYSLIQALSLANGVGIKSRDLIKIDDKILNKNSWETVVSIAENKVLPYLTQIQNFGIGDVNKWLPYNPIVTLLITFHLSSKFIDSKKIDTWYWSAVFSERYSGSTEATMMKDFQEMMMWFNNDRAVPEVVREFYNHLSKGLLALKNVNRVSSSKYKGFFNLIFKNGATDFYTPERLAFNELEDHHIFPKAFLKRKGVKVDHDTVLNRTLIFEETNREISNKAPGEYLKEMIEKYIDRGVDRPSAERRVKEILRKHFIDDEMFEILKNTTSELSAEDIKKNFDAFIEKREKLIYEQLKMLTSMDEYFTESDQPSKGKRELMNDFWKSFLEKINQKSDLFVGKNPPLKFSIERGIYKNVSLVCSVAHSFGMVELRISSTDKGKNKMMFDRLYSKKEELEKELGTELVWLRLDQRRSSCIRKYFREAGVLDINEWNVLQENMIDFILKLLSVARRYRGYMEGVEGFWAEGSL